MLGGKKARDARIHTSYGGSLDSRGRKDKSSWTEYEWISEVADYFNLNHWCFYCDFYAKANYDSIDIEASVTSLSVSDSTIFQEAKNLVQKAINATQCPYKINIELEVYR